LSSFCVSLVDSFFPYTYDFVPNPLPPTALGPEPLKFGDDMELDSELVTQSRSCNE
jgi:hypothetical protein